MGAIIDYFRCDPFEFNFRLLVFSGFWPLETKSKAVKIIYSIYSYLSCFSIISMLFIQILDIYLLRNDPLILVQNLCASVVTFATIGKYLLLFYKIEEIIDLNERLDEFRRTRSDPEEIEIIKKGNEQIMWATKAFYGLAIPCIIAWMLYPGLDSSEKKRVPFPYRLPLDMTKTPIYEILYIYQSMSMVGFMINILSNDLIFYGFVIRINTEYDAVIKRIEKMEELWMFESEWKKTTRRFDSADTKKMMKNVKDISVTHQTILSKVDDLKKIYSYPFLVHAFTVLTLVGVNMIDVVVVSKGFRLQILQRMMYTVCGLFDTYLICLYSSEMQHQAVKLFRSIYSTPWYRVNPKVRRDLQMISLRSSVSPTIRVGNMFPLNLASFLQFLKTSYNLTTLLYQTIKT